MIDDEKRASVPRAKQAGGDSNASQHPIHNPVTPNSSQSIERPSPLAKASIIQLVTTDRPTRTHDRAITGNKSDDAATCATAITIMGMARDEGPRADQCTSAAMSNSTAVCTASHMTTAVSVDKRVASSSTDGSA